MGQFRQRINAWVFDFYNSYIGVNRTEGEVFRRSGIGFGESIKEGRFSDIGKSYNSDFHYDTKRK
jgi:hypothetical protein